MSKREFVLRLSLVIVMIVSALLSVQAQDTQRTWQQAYEELMSFADSGDDNGDEELYEQLQTLAENPIDLNHATRDDLERLPFMSAQQVMDLVEYLDRYGPMRSLSELRMVGSLDYRQIELLPYFVFIGPVSEDKFFVPKLSDVLHYGRHTLTATGRVPFYERQGDRNGYLGYRYRHTLRYEFNYNNRVRAALIGAQDAGEPFFANRNKWGYDAYNYYLQIANTGFVENIVVGKYRLSTGMGLVLNTSFSLGKQATLASLGRQTNTLRPHSSRSEADYFQGAAATLRLSEPFRLTLFGSYRPIDATLNIFNNVQTLVTSGYHRTPAEMDKKYNTHLTSGGAHVAYRYEGLRLGATAVYTHSDRILEPYINITRSTEYRRYMPAGQNFFNASVNYSYTHHRFSLHGETATDRDGHIATVNALSVQPTPRVSAVALYRFYSYRYATLHGHSFCDGPRVQNEQGLFAGVNWNPLAYIYLQAFADYAYSPQPKYLISMASHSWDLFLQSEYRRTRWKLLSRFRARLRQRNDEYREELTANNNYSGRLSLTYNADDVWNLKTQLDVSRAYYNTVTYGYMVSEQFTMHQPRWTLHATAALFHTDDYSSRIYLYEHQLAHEYSSPSYYGRGLRLLLQATADVSRKVRLCLRLGHTNYFDRSTISSGNQLINHSSMTDLDLQLRLKL